MSDNEGESYETEIGENECGVILGYWNHEETPTLIEDLEHSVDSVERKCKNLLEELMYYKRYLNESEGPEARLAVLKKKDKKSKNSNFFSGSDPDLAFRKNLVNLQETRQVFEEKFQEKLFSINKELRAAAQKLGLKNSIILFPAGDYLRNLRKQTEHEARKSWSDVRDNFIKLSSFKAKTGSDSIILDTGGDEQCAKITRNELELYQKLSRLSLKKTARVKSKARKTISSKGRKIKFCCRKKTPRFWQEPPNPGSRQKNSKRRRTKVVAALKGARHSPTRFCLPGNSPTDRDSPEAQAGAATGRKKSKENAAVEEKAPMGTAIRKCVPFTACASTSRSHNIGVNMQQLLSLWKWGGKSSARVSPSKHTLEEGSKFWKEMNCGEVEKRRSASWIHGAKSDGFDVEERGGKVWVSERRTSSNSRKARSRYTGNPPGRLMEYHKSIMSRYSDGQKSMIKSESESAYAVGSKIMVSGCERTDVFEMGLDDGLPGRASGDGAHKAKVAGPSAEWTKVCGSFFDTYRKYMSLKGKLSDNNSVPSTDELKSLENEIDCAIEKYKDFLKFYSKFLHLKHRHKSLKIACETKRFVPVASFSSNYRRKLNACRPTCSMAMKKAFKEVRALQDKINLVGD